MTHPLDTSNFRQMILDSPDQFRVGFELAKGIKFPGTFTSIMISGMGGSALPGSIFRVYLNDLFRSGLRRSSRFRLSEPFSTLPPESYHECLNFICPTRQHRGDRVCL
jgi:hypothetical protein